MTQGKAQQNFFMICRGLFLQKLENVPFPRHFRASFIPDDFDDDANDAGDATHRPGRGQISWTRDSGDLTFKLFP